MENPWRLHLANSAIQHLDVIAGDPPLLAVWARDGRVSFCDLERGASHGAKSYTLPEQHEDYAAFASSLKDPKDRILAYARIGGRSFWPLTDGRVLEYGGGAKVEVHSAIDSIPITLLFDVTPSALAIDPKTLLVAALDSKGALLLGKVGGTVKTLKPGLTPSDEMPLSVVVARGGKRIVVSDGARLIVIDSGKVSSRRDLHYSCGLLALSPSGEYLMTFDSDSGVLRAYNPDALKLTHQRFVSDLLSAADELQLTGFAELPPTSAALSAITVENQGRFAFAVFGQICGASIGSMTSTDGRPVGGLSATVPDATPVKPAVEQKQEQRVQRDELVDAPTSLPKATEKPAVKPAAVTGGAQRSSNVRPAPKPTSKLTAVKPADDDETLPIDPPHSDDL